MELDREQREREREWSDARLGVRTGTPSSGQKIDAYFLLLFPPIPPRYNRLPRHLLYSCPLGVSSTHHPSRIARLGKWRGSAPTTDNPLPALRCASFRFGGVVATPPGRAPSPPPPPPSPLHPEHHRRGRERQATNSAQRAYESGYAPCHLLRPSVVW